MKYEKNISYIRQRLEPSTELKRSVMERASKLEAGRKTFGDERTTDSIEIKKEQITMNANNTKETASVKKRFPVGVISAAACAAIVCGIAAVNLKEEKPKPRPMTSTESSTAEEPTVTKEEDSISETVMTVTEQDGSSYTITDKDRIAAINEIVEKAKQCNVWTYGEVPTARTLEYYVDGKKQTVEISEDRVIPEELREGRPYHPELCDVVTVDGGSYVLCETCPDEPLSELLSSTSKGGDLTFQRWNDDKYEDGTFYMECSDEPAARKLRDIIDDIRRNAAPQYETDDMFEWFECDKTPDWENVRVTCTDELDGNNYHIELYNDTDLIVLDVYEWSDGKTHHLIYKDTKNWTAEFDEVFDAVENGRDIDDSQAEEKDTESSKAEETKPAVTQAEEPKPAETQSEETKPAETQSEETKPAETQSEEPKPAETQSEETKPAETQAEEPKPAETQAEDTSDEGFEIPDIFDMTEEEAVSTLDGLGLNCVIQYAFDHTEKGLVCSYYNPNDDPFDNTVHKGDRVTVVVSLGDYEGEWYDSPSVHATGNPVTEDIMLEVPVPDGLSGSYTFSIFFGDEEEYTTAFDNIESVDSIAFDTREADKQVLAVYAKNNDAQDGKYIRYAAYEADLENKTYNLIGELNTDALLRTMN